SEGRKR
ncbi:hypothetical protein VN97_g6140, partial [Penicillium thymicola]